MKIKNLLPCIVILLITAASVYLRFHNLGHLNFWIDEPYHAYSAQSLLDTGHPVMPSGLEYGRAPIYTGAVALSIKIFGMSEFAVRFPSALFGVLSVLLVYWIGKKLFGCKVGLLAAFFLAVSYYATGWARISRFYTLLQFLYLAGVYLFYRGFEHKRIIQQKVFTWRGLGIQWGWFLLSMLLLLLALSVQLITVMFFAVALVFIVVMAVGSMGKVDIKSVLLSRYGLSLGVAGLAVLAGFLVFGLNDFISWALSHQPVSFTSARYQDAFFYFKFFNSPYMFPLNAFFLIGLLYAVLRLDKGAIYTTLHFLIPVGMASVLFSYKLSNYTFHVFPFFVLIAAYGVMRIQTDGFFVLSRWVPERFPKWPVPHPFFIRGFLVVLLMGWLPLTLWFRLGLRMPVQRPGQNNLVTVHRNFAWAAEFVNARKADHDVVISGIPLTLMYYGLDSDYTLNEGRLIDSKRKGFVDGSGRVIEPYSGVPMIENLIGLKDIIASRESGWLVFDLQRFRSGSTMFDGSGDFILDSIPVAAKDEEQTMIIFHWTDERVRQ